MRYILRVNGTREDLPGPLSMAEIRERIGAISTDHVNLRHLGWPLHVMIVEDLGYQTRAVQEGNMTVLVPLKARKPINEAATMLYHANCVPGTTHKIAGDVAVVPDFDFGGIEA